MTTGLSSGSLQAGHHIVQLYRDDHELIAAVGVYLATAIQAGETVVAIAKSAHRREFEQQMSATVHGLSAVRESGQCVLLDAADVMPMFIDEGRVDGTGFLSVIGQRIETAVERGEPVRVYGEMVTVLWEAGELVAAIELETLWNELGESLPFSLVCAYPADMLSARGHADEMQQVCGLHSFVLHPTPSVAELTPPGTTEISAQFVAGLGAPRAARHLVVNALRQLELDNELIDDAALVLTELATNAVVHANSPFSVLIVVNGAGVRISVSDDVGIKTSVGEELPSRPGHGLSLIAALASNWGVELSCSGKAVWAELDVNNVVQSQHSSSH